MPSRSNRRKSASRRTSSSRTASKRKGTGRRELLKNPAGNFYARRNASGEFKEMDEQGRSLSTDRRRKAKTKVRAGYGDRGDRPAR